MDPLTIAAVLSAVQGVAGLAKTATNKRPEYEIPSEVNTALALAQAQAQGNMPGYNNAQDQINLTTSNALSTGAQSGNVLAVLPSVVAAQSTGLNNLAAKNASYIDGKQRDYQRALMQKAQYQDKKWMANEFAPYAEAQQEGRDMFGAGLEGVTGALDAKSASSVLSSAMLDAGNAMNVQGITSDVATQIAAKYAFNQMYDEKASKFGLQNYYDDVNATDYSTVG